MFGEACSAVPVYKSKNNESKNYEINNSIQSYKNEIINRTLYKELNGLDDIAILMENHVYAVWDFMSLLKSLQSILTCTSSP